MAIGYFKFESEAESSDKQRSMKLFRAALTVVDTLYKIYNEKSAELLKMNKSEAEHVEMWEAEQ